MALANIQCLISHHFQVYSYSGTLLMDAGRYISSPVFTMDGRDWALNYFPNGIEKDHPSQDLHVRLQLLSADSGEITLNVSGSYSTANLLIKMLPVCHTFKSTGDYCDFKISKEEYEKRYLRGDFLDFCILTPSTGSLEEEESHFHSKNHVVAKSLPEHWASITRGVFHLLHFNDDDAQKMPVGSSISWPIFAAGGYKWVIKYYPHGNEQNEANSASLEKHVGWELELRSNSQDVKATVRFHSLCGAWEMSGRNKLPFKTSAVFKSNSETHFFSIPRSEFEADYIRNPAVEMYVSIATASIELSLSIPSPHLHAYLNQGEKRKPVPHSLPDDLSQFLDTDHGMTDVMFEVEGKKVMAHRQVLSSRSSVLKEKFCASGVTAESSAEHIPINDMNAVVFRSLLEYIYTDALPDDQDIAITATSTEPTGTKMTPDVVAQQLLLAADRFALHRLREVYEEIVLKSICLGNMIDVLLLAEKHKFSHLRSACITFMAENFYEFTRSPRVLDIVKACPDIIIEIQDKLAAIRTSLI